MSIGLNNRALDLMIEAAKAAGVWEDIAPNTIRTLARALRADMRRQEREPHKPLFAGNGAGTAPFSELDGLMDTMLNRMFDESAGPAHIPDVEEMAEWLAADQLALLAHVEVQLRAVHHTMRRIEKLRGGKQHVGPVLSSGERGRVIEGLSAEIAHLDEQLSAQAGCCHEMLCTVERMRQRIVAMRGTSQFSLGH